MNENNPYLDLDYGLVFTAIIESLSQKNITIEEETIINAIKARRIKKEDLDTIIRTLDSSQNSLINLRIYIWERKKDFVESFKLNL